MENEKSMFVIETRTDIGMKFCYVVMAENQEEATAIVAPNIWEDEHITFVRKVWSTVFTCVTITQYIDRIKYSF